MKSRRGGSGIRSVAPSLWAVAAGLVLRLPASGEAGARGIDP